MRAFLRVCAPLAAGLLLCASFAPLRLWPAAFFGLAILVRIARTSGYIGAFFSFAAAGLCFFFPLVRWAAIASGTILGQAALAVFLSIFLAFLGLFWRFLAAHTPSWLTPLALATSWVAMEQLQATWPYGGMPWGTLAFGQASGPLLPLASLGSTQLIGWAAVLVACLLEGAARFHHGFSSTLRVVAALAIVVLPVLVPLGNRPESTVHVGFVQGRVPASDTLLGAERALAVTRNLAEESKNLAGRGAQMVLWPESASDLDPLEDSQALAPIEETLASLNVPLLLGTQRYISNYRYNDYTLWLPGQGIQARYSKQHPVPFGEYIPSRDFFRRFTTAIDQVSIDMRAGTEPAFLDVPVGESSVRVATPICFEVAYAPIIHQAVGEGAQLVVVPTNNASFGDSSESEQQFDQSRLRAVETGRTVIQVSTVGVSGIIEANGVVREKTAMWEPDARVAKVHLSSHRTLATTIYPHIAIGFYGATLFFGAVALMKAVRARQRRMP